MSGSSLEVDIDYYPPMAQKGAMRKTVDRITVYGVYAFASRWLGAAILFANSIFGRILLLAIPAVLLFFHKPITNFFERRRRSIDDEFA
jgi:hypothetical protein